MTADLASFKRTRRWQPLQLSQEITLKPRPVADFNGDGKADLIFEGLDNSFWVSFSTDSGFSAPQFWY